MPADEPAKLWRSLTDEDLAFLPPIQTANGVPLTARQLRRAHLVTAGDGVYRVALGDPYGADPQWLATPDGRHWQIDMRELARMKAGR